MDIPPLNSSDVSNSGMVRYFNDLRIHLKKGLIRYTTSEYSSLNTLLRDGLITTNLDHRASYPSEIKWIHQLDNVIAASPKLNHPFHVYRGMVLSDLITDHINRTGYLNNLSYLSTSFDIHVARGFAGGSCCLFKVLVPDPRDLDYVYIKTRTKGEQEILFQRNTHFKLVASPYKYKYYPVGSMDYELITIYVVTIHPGILVPTRVTKSSTIETIDPRIKVLNSFTRYVEAMDASDIDLFYGNEPDIPMAVVDEFIRTHPHYNIDNPMKKNLLGVAMQIL